MRIGGGGAAAPEVCKLNMACLGDEDVLRLQVSEKEARVVDAAERRRHLPRHKARARLVKGPVLND